MITLEIEDAPELDALLQPDDRVVKAADDARDLRPLSGQLSLAPPVSRPFTAEQAAIDPALGRFLEVESDFAFHLVHLACTFRPVSGEPFQSAWVQIRLNRDDGVDDPPAVAWSMSPDRSVDNVPYSRTVSLSTDLKLLGGVGVTGVGIEAGASGTKSEVFLEASGLLQSDPAWEFTRTSRVGISGSQRLLLVVRAPRQVSIRGDVQLSATLRRSRLGLISYTAEFPGVGSVTFAL